MSLILDALSRSERERRAEAQGVPDLLVAQPVNPLRRRWPWLLALAVLFVGAGVAAALFFYRAGSDPATPESAQVAATPIPETTPSLPPRAAPRAAAEIATPGTSGDAGIPVAIGPERAPERATADVAAVARLYEAQRVESAPQASSQPQPVEADPLAEAASAAPARETPVDLAAALRQAQEAVADASMSQHSTPLLSQQSKQFRDRVPTLMYLRHDYRSAGSSAVTINGESLRAGQRSGPVQVVEILPDSVILRFDGEDFRLRALNSWINL